MVVMCTLYCCYAEDGEGSSSGNTAESADGDEGTKPNDKMEVGDNVVSGWNDTTPAWRSWRNKICYFTWVKQPVYVNINYLCVIIIITVRLQDYVYNICLV